MQTKYRQHLGKTQGCVVLVAWFVGCLVGYQCKASIDSILGKHSLVARFAGGLVGYPPFLFYSASFAWCVGWFGLLGLLFAWIWRKHIQGCMDHGQGDRFLFAGLLVCLP